MTDISQININNTDYNFVDDTKVPYNLLRDTVGFISKNVCDTFHPISVSTAAERGITWTLNSDGSWTANGTVITYAYINFTDRTQAPFMLKANKGLKVNGLPNVNSAKFIIAWIENNETITVRLNNNEILPAVNYDRACTLQIALVSNGVTVSNAVFKPLFYYSDIFDDTYEPYHIPGVVSQEAQNVLGAKNFLRNTKLVTGTIKNGVTITVNSDDSLTFNGTASADSYWNFNYVNNTDSKGSYDITPLIGKRLKASISKVKHNSLRLHNGYFTANDASYVDTINTVVYTEDEFVYPTQAVRAKDFIEIKSGGVFNNFTIYPMVRLAEIQDDTYAQHAMTNRELTDLFIKPPFSILNGAVQFARLDVQASSGTHPTIRIKGTIDYENYIIVGNDQILYRVQKNPTVVKAQCIYDSIEDESNRLQFTSVSNREFDMSNPRDHGLGIIVISLLGGVELSYPT